MSLKKYLTSIPIMLTAIFAVGSYIGIVYALNSWDTGYQLTSGQVRDMTLADATCKRVTNNATNRFIGTKTMAEWNSFNAVAASQGVTVAGCGPTYPGCNTPDISFPLISQSWAACNIGAATPSGYGNYYQWGVNNTSFVVNRNTGPAGTWGQGPCAAGYHVPSAAEFHALATSSYAYVTGGDFSTLIGLPKSDLKWPNGSGPYNPGSPFPYIHASDHGVMGSVWYPNAICHNNGTASSICGANADGSSFGYAMPIRCKHD